MTDFKNNNPFKVPKGYFDELEEQLCSSEDSISKLNPFSTPENYFENLEDLIYRKLHIQKTEKKSTSNYLLLKFSSVAASLILLITLFEKTSPTELENDQAINDFIETYYIENFDSYDMLSMMEDTEIELTIAPELKP